MFNFSNFFRVLLVLSFIQVLSAFGAIRRPSHASNIRSAINWKSAISNLRSDFTFQRTSMEQRLTRKFNDKLLRLKMSDSVRALQLEEEQRKIRQEMEEINRETEEKLEQENEELRQTINLQERDLKEMQERLKRLEETVNKLSQFVNSSQMVVGGRYDVIANYSDVTQSPANKNSTLETEDQHHTGLPTGKLM